MKLSSVRSRLRPIALLCATAAVTVGLIYFTLAEAPLRYAVVNLLTLAGCALFLLGNPDKWPLPATRGVALTAGLLLIVVSIVGVKFHGVSRWLIIGGMQFEPGLIVVPSVVLLFAGNQQFGTLAGILLTAIATALQPDRSMAAALCLGLLCILALKRNKWIIISLVVAVGAAAVTWMRPDHVPPAPFVEEVFVTAYRLHPFLAGVMVLAALLLLTPAFIGLRNAGKKPEAYSAFLGIWSTLFIASGLGNYPTPLIGYGASAIMGYMLSVMMLPRISHPHDSVHEGFAGSKTV